MASPIKIGSQRFSHKHSATHVAEKLVQIHQYTMPPEATLKSIQTAFGQERGSRIISIMEKLIDDRREYIRKKYRVGSIHELTVVGAPPNISCKGFVLKTPEGFFFKVPKGILLYNRHVVKCKVKNVNLEANAVNQVGFARYDEKPLVTLTGSYGTVPEKIEEKTALQNKRRESLLDQESTRKSVSNPISLGGYSPSYWMGKVEGFDYHRYGKEFVCSCCRRKFGPRQGFKMEMNEEVIFCRECKDQIVTRTGHKRAPVIYTPMGNKR